MRGKAGNRAALAALVAVALPVGRAGAAPLVTCGRVVTRNLTLQTDLGSVGIGCTGDGLVVGKAGITIDLNGHNILGQAYPIPGSAGIRNTGYARVKIVDTSGGLGQIGGFAASIRLTDANRNAVIGVAALDGVSLVRSDSAVIRNSTFNPPISWAATPTPHPPASTSRTPTGPPSAAT